LTLKRLAKAPEFARPHDPKKPFPYAAEEVVYENKAAGVKLAATLTLPKGAGPFPAVVLITGSGPQDRDETVAGHRPFLVLADYLTRRGIAVLRADDRGVGGSTGDVFKSTTADFADDALAGVAYLKGRKEVHPKQIGLLGHSEGGIAAPLAAVKSADIAFIVLLAGTGLPGEELLYLQGERVGRAAGAGEKELARGRALQEAFFAILKKEKDAAAVRKQLLAAVEAERAKLSDEEKKAAKGQEVALQAQLKMIQTPWFRYFLTHDPRPALRQVRCPVLALNGAKDVQVPSKENLGAIEKALREGGNKDFTVKELPGLNHLFQTCKTGGIAEYGTIEETIAPAVLDLVADWVRQRTSIAK
jgi:fermentation-respiration switch protein FrsA (DUF1100 family)